MERVAIILMCMVVTRAANITAMACNETSRTCTVAAAVGLTVDFAKPLREEIQYFVPQPPNPCNSSLRLCYGVQTSTNVISVSGVVPDASINYFKFTSTTGETALTILQRGRTIPDPPCPSGEYCTYPEAVTTTTDGTVTTTGIVVVPVPFAKPVVKAYKSDGVTEVADVFGPAPDKLEITNTDTGSTVMALAGVMLDSTVDRLLLISGLHEISIMLSRSGSSVPCGSGYVCTSPPSAVIQSDNSVNLPQLSVNFATDQFEVKAFAGRSERPGVAGFDDACDKAIMACVRVRFGTTWVNVRGKVSNPEVTLVLFLSWANINMFIKRDNAVTCPPKQRCTEPKVLSLGEGGAFPNTALRTPFLFESVNAVGLAYEETKPGTFGGADCDPSKVACHSSFISPTTAVLRGNITQVPFRVEVTLKSGEPYNFYFNIGNTVVASAVLFILMVTVF